LPHRDRLALAELGPVLLGGTSGSERVGPVGEPAEELAVVVVEAGEEVEVVGREMAPTGQAATQRLQSAQGLSSSGLS
jgi:hypothetical protein